MWRQQQANGLAQTRGEDMNAFENVTPDMTRGQAVAWYARKQREHFNTGTYAASWDNLIEHAETLPDDDPRLDYLASCGAFRYWESDIPFEPSSLPSGVQHDPYAHWGGHGKAVGGSRMLNQIAGLAATVKGAPPLPDFENLAEPPPENEPA